MKSKAKKTGFSIIELLTVMSIIIILLGILVPSLAAVRRYSRKVKQRGQFHEIGKGLEMFSVDHDGYPDSYWNDMPDDTGDPYCGAMKLCEAMVGQDGLGFHPDSVFDDKGQIDLGAGLVDLYFNRIPLGPLPYQPDEEQNLRARQKYLEGEDVQIASVETLFGTDYGQFDPCCPVLCDVFRRTSMRKADGSKLGMPILYYKADISKLVHDYLEQLPAFPDAGPNIYNVYDNHQLTAIEVPWIRGTFHPLYLPAAAPWGGPDGGLFYVLTRNKEIITADRPHNPESYILISAGHDGLYGTEDDVFNFD